MASEPKKQKQTVVDLDSIFMEMADLVSRHSNESKKKHRVGACIVSKDDEIVGLGYNRMPKGINNDPDSEFWKDKNIKRAYVCHAELNAFVNKNHKSVKDGKIYVTSFPCDTCFKIIVKSDIKQIKYMKTLPNHPKQKYMEKMIESIALIHVRDICDKALTFYNQGSEDNWDDYFIRVAYLSSRRCQDTEKGNGACIVNSDNKILGVGYSNYTDIESHQVEYCAELNAYINSQQGCIENGKIYVTSYPCRECAKLITQCGIKKLYYFDEKEKDPVSVKIFNAAGVETIPMSKLSLTTSEN